MGELEAVAQNYALIAAGSAIAGGIIAGIAGYVLGKKTHPPQEPISDTTRRKEIELETLRAGSAIELKKLEYEEAARVHTRGLEERAEQQKLDLAREAVNRQYSLEDDQRQYQRDQAKEIEEKKSDQAEREIALKSAEALRPSLEAYLAGVKQANDTHNQYRLERQRAKDAYRVELVEEHLQEHKGKVFDANEDVADDDTSERIDKIVEMKFPNEGISFQQPELPEEVRNLIDFIIPDDDQDDDQ